MARHYSTDRSHYSGLSTKFPSEYGTYLQMIDRCYNPNHKSWRNYGGRGIKVCRRWLTSFKNFFDDMGTRPTSKHSLDRFPDQNGNYSPDNCRWATSKEQARNTRTNTILTLNGESHCLAEWAEITGIRIGCILERISKGWSIERVLNTDPKEYNRNRPAQMFTHKGITKPLIQWAEEQGISMPALKGRIKRGWSIKKALFTPIRKTKAYIHWTTGKLTHPRDGVTKKGMTRK